MSYLPRIFRGKSYWWNDLKTRVVQNSLQNVGWVQINVLNIILTGSIPHLLSLPFLTSLLLLLLNSNKASGNKPKKYCNNLVCDSVTLYTDSKDEEWNNTNRQSINLCTPLPPRTSFVMTSVSKGCPWSSVLEGLRTSDKEDWTVTLLNRLSFPGPISHRWPNIFRHSHVRCSILIPLLVRIRVIGSRRMD